MGSKAERVIGASNVKEIINDSERYFKFENTYQGIESIIRSINYQVQQYDPRLDRLGLGQGLVITIVAALVSLIVIILLVWLCIRQETKRAKKWKNTVNYISTSSTSASSNAKNDIINNTEYHLVKGDEIKNENTK